MGPPWWNLLEIRLPGARGSCSGELHRRHTAPEPLRAGGIWLLGTAGCRSLWELGAGGIICTAGAGVGRSCPCSRSLTRTRKQNSFLLPSLQCPPQTKLNFQPAVEEKYLKGPDSFSQSRKERVNFAQRGNKLIKGTRGNIHTHTHACVHLHTSAGLLSEAEACEPYFFFFPVVEIIDSTFLQCLHFLIS